MSSTAPAPAEETRFKRELLDPVQLFGSGVGIVNCTECEAIFPWPLHPKIRLPRFCPGCGRRNVDAP